MELVQIYVKIFLLFFQFFPHGSGSRRENWMRIRIHSPVILIKKMLKGQHSSTITNYLSTNHLQKCNFYVFRSLFCKHLISAPFLACLNSTLCNACLFPTPHRIQNLNWAKIQDPEPNLMYLVPQQTMLRIRIKIIRILPKHNHNFFLF